ncbi:MAG TPA: aminoacyl-tRNA hydrolase [Pseudonocardiaceae bacterium]|nr:aminoacyl-tRNA hydrolase [Pseudonocardiaceae bacterium]
MTADAGTDQITGEITLVVGLGNPGPGYAGNRHNVGAMVVDELARRVGGHFRSHKAGADVLEARLAGRRTVLARPRSFMNVSGPPVAATARFFKVAPADVIVIHDDLDLDHGVLKLKHGGGEGGHNGLRSITTSLGSRDYLRVRFGIGRPPGRMDPADFVLRDFSAVQRRDLDLLVDRCADAIEQLLAQGLAATQNQVHRAPAT